MANNCARVKLSLRWIANGTSGASSATVAIPFYTASTWESECISFFLFVSCRLKIKHAYKLSTTETVYLIAKKIIKSSTELSAPTAIAISAARCFKLVKIIIFIRLVLVAPSAAIRLATVKKCFYKVPRFGIRDVVQDLPLPMA